MLQQIINKLYKEEQIHKLLTIYGIKKQLQKLLLLKLNQNMKKVKNMPILIELHQHLKKSIDQVLENVLDKLIYLVEQHLLKQLVVDQICMYKIKAVT